jgi:hypothetical protein
LGSKRGELTALIDAGSSSALLKATISVSSNARLIKQSYVLLMRAQAEHVESDAAPQPVESSTISCNHYTVACPFNDRKRLLVGR